MENFICINGNRVELTDQQIKELGFSLNPFLVSFMELVRSGKVREQYNVRDVIKIDDYELKIIGFNHDKDINNTDAPTVTVIGTKLLPYHRMHGGACEKGWVDTELRKYLNGEVYNSLPSELKQYICEVKKATHNYKGDIYDTVDKLFIPSESELFGSAIYAGYEDGERYEAFATRKDRILVDSKGSSDWYWNRSFYGGYSTYAAYVGNNGHANYFHVDNSYVRAPLCFTLA